jgi:hypothetical protein
MFSKTSLSHSNIFFFATILLAVSLPFSHTLMSVSQIILLANWLLEGNLKTKIQIFFNNKTAIVLSGVFVIHLIGMAWTTDLVYGLEDLRKKIPLLLLPLIYSTSVGFSKQDFHKILLFFIAAVLLATIVSMVILSGVTPVQVTDIRHISPFISHIRLSLMICLAIIISMYFFKQNLKISWIWILISLWLITFLSILESLTGIFILALCAFVIWVIRIIKMPNIYYKITGFTLPAIVISASVIFYNIELKKIRLSETIDLSTLEEYSNKGEKYLHLLTSEAENGFPVRIYIAKNEMGEYWNAISPISIDSTDKKGHQIEETLIRFLTSKGLRKDAEGVMQLSKNEIRSIESGIANVDFQDRGNIYNRIRKVIWEVEQYKRGQNPTGHSLTMRFEFWKAAIEIISNNTFLGVGTGDVPTSFHQQYENSETLLEKTHWLRSHNQFLTIGVAIGLIGMIYFIFSLGLPFIILNTAHSYLYIGFFMIAFFSMLWEDTLETQAGITFFSFFNCVLLFWKNKNSSENYFSDKTSK